MKNLCKKTAPMGQKFFLLMLFSAFSAVGHEEATLGEEQKQLTLSVYGKTSTLDPEIFRSSRPALSQAYTVSDGQKETPSNKSKTISLQGSSDTENQNTGKDTPSNKSKTISLQGSSDTENQNTGKDTPSNKSKTISLQGSSDTENQNTDKDTPSNKSKTISLQGSSDTENQNTGKDTPSNKGKTISSPGSPDTENQNTGKDTPSTKGKTISSPGSPDTENQNTGKDTPSSTGKTTSSPGSSDTENQNTGKDTPAPTSKTVSSQGSLDTENQNTGKDTPSNKDKTISLQGSSDTENQNTDKDTPSNKSKTISLQGSSDTENQNTGKDTPSSTFHLSNEIQLSHNSISGNEHGFFADIPYTKLSLDYSLTFVNFFMEVQLSSQDQWKMNLSELRLTRSFKKIPVKIEIGYLPLPLGYRPENSDRFLREPVLYRSLTKREEDMGLTAQVNLWKQYLYLQISCFGGYVKRGGEDFYRTPDTPSLIMSLKTKSPLGEGFVSWFKEDTALFNPRQAVGGGGRLSHSLSLTNFKISLQGELWRMEEKNQTALAWYLFPQIELFDKWKAGVVLGDINYFSPSVKNTQAKSSLYERVFQISWRIHPALTLTAEKFLTGQRKGPFLNSLWAVRAQSQFDF